jgi:16S rRNA processing protein RimM
MPDARILLGVLGRPHGVRGLMHVHSYTADPDDLASYGPLVDDGGRLWTLAWRGTGVAELRDQSGHPLADRTAAERLVNTRLYIDRDRLPEPDEDEFYLADLMGLAAITPEGKALGRVTVVHDYGAGPSLEITGEGAPLLIPFTRACVPVVDIKTAQITVVLPAEVNVAPDASDDLPLPLGEGRGEGHAPEAIGPSS